MYDNELINEIANSNKKVGIAELYCEFFKMITCDDKLVISKSTVIDILNKSKEKAIKNVMEG